MTVEVDFNSLIGETFVEINGLYEDSNQVEFITKSGRRFIMYHSQSCCEYVRIEDICGDYRDLLNTPITLVRESSDGNVEDYNDYINYSHTWTFYTLATVKGYVDFRWLGESNGYYSERVSFEEELTEEEFDKRYN